MIGVVRRRTPHRHDRVADKLVYVPTSGINLGDDKREVAISEFDKLGRRQPGGQRGKTRKICKHHGYLSLNTAELELLPVFRQLFDHGRREISAEGPLHSSASPLRNQIPGGVDEHARQY